MESPEVRLRAFFVAATRRLCAGCGASACPLEGCGTIWLATICAFRDDFGGKGGKTDRESGAIRCVLYTRVHQAGCSMRGIVRRVRPACGARSVAACVPALMIRGGPPRPIPPVAPAGRSTPGPFEFKGGSSSSAKRAFAIRKQPPHSRMCDLRARAIGFPHRKVNPS